MHRPKKPLAPNPPSEGDIFPPQPGLRQSALCIDGKPDPRLINLVHLLARIAATEHLEAECTAQQELEDRTKETPEKGP